MAKSGDKLTQIIYETYDMLFKASIPSVSFYDLLDQCLTYEDSEHNIITVEHPLSEIERKAGNLKYAIDFYAYFIPEDKFMNIVEEQSKKYKLSKLDKSSFNMAMFLGCGPTSALNRWLEKHSEYTETTAANLIRETYPDFLIKNEKQELNEKQYS